MQKSIERYYLLNEGELLMIISEVREVLDDLENLLANKKWILKDLKNRSINIDSDILMSGPMDELFKI